MNNSVDNSNPVKIFNVNRCDYFVNVVSNVKLGGVLFTTFDFHGLKFIVQTSNNKSMVSFLDDVMSAFQSERLSKFEFNSFDRAVKYALLCTENRMEWADCESAFNLDY